MSRNKQGREAKKPKQPKSLVKPAEVKARKETRQIFKLPE